MRPDVVIRPRHLTILCTSRSEDQDEESVVTLLDNELSGDVAPQESAWTVSDQMLIIELLKKPDYTVDGSPGAERRPPWWPCAVRSGKSGPKDPKAPEIPQPNIQKLTGRIGAQEATKA